MAEVAKGYVYLLEIGGKQYVGLTTNNPEHRWLSHQSSTHKGKKGCGKVIEALKIYGRHGVKKFILEVVSSDSYETMLRRLAEREAYWIDHFSSDKKGLNTTPGMKGKAVDSFVKRMLNLLVFYCPHCPVRNAYLKHHLRHLQENHPGCQEEKLIHACRWIVKGCKSPFYETTESKNSHQQEAHGCRGFLCDYCLESYHTEKDLSDHRWKNHGKRRLVLDSPPPRKKREPKTINEPFVPYDPLLHNPCSFLANMDGEYDEMQVMDQLVDVPYGYWMEWSIHHQPLAIQLEAERKISAAPCKFE